MTVIKSAMILDTDNATHHDVIVLDEFDIMPYKKIPCSKFNFLPMFKGDTIEIEYAQTGLILTKQHNYKDHNYDIVVVLGHDKTNSNLFVYGNKFEEQIISNTYRNMRTIKRGDELLIKKILTVPQNPFKIIHNITQTKLKYEMNQNGPKIR